MSKFFKLLSAAVLLMAFIGCEKKPVDDGKEPDIPEPEQKYERYVKGQRFRSELLGEYITYSLFMPADYETETDKTYPVVYFLHGIGESSTKDWTEYMKVIEGLEDNGLQEMIYVFPNGFNSYYSNTYDGEFPYMDMFIDELVPHIDTAFRTKADRQFRAVTGYSMGGFGTTVLALKHPETFGMSAPMSISLCTDKRYITESQDGWENQWGRIFGGIGQKGKDRITDYYKEHCPYYQFTPENKEILSQVKWFFHCGDDEDQLLIANDSLHVLLRDNGYEHEFRISNGAHTGSYWRTAMRETLPWIEQMMNAGGEWTKVMGTVSLKSSELNEDGTFSSKAYKEATEKDGLATWFVHEGLSKETVEKCIGLLSQSGSIFQYMILPCDLEQKTLEEWMTYYKGIYEVGKSADKSQIFAIGETGRIAWDLKDEFKRFYLIDADLTDDTDSITAEEDKFYYIDTVDDSEYYKDSNALYVSCKATGADFEYRMRNGISDKEQQLMLAIQSAAEKFKYQ